MKIKTLKTEKPYESRNDKSLGIQTFGDNNDYPQKVDHIVRKSSTGMSCLNNYQKFIQGRGFVDTAFFEEIMNHKGQTAGYILSQISSDLAKFGGFCLHTNYNANYRITEVQHVPFEHVRFEAMDDEGEFDKVAIHWDWSREFTQLRRWRKADIDFVHLYNPNPAVIQQQVDSVGGWAHYNGQVYYFSNEGDRTYPLPIFESTLTDMSTEEGISNISYRNARKSFLSAGMLIDRRNADQTAEQENATEKSLLDFQGDAEAGKIMYVEVNSDDEVPQFVPFAVNNFDKDFEVTRKAVRESIGISFNQPPILRSEDVGGNFGADLMNNAYNYYNSVTEKERMAIERVFADIFSHWYKETTNNYGIMPLKYQ